MRLIIPILLSLVLVPAVLCAQRSPAAAYDKLLQLTAVFNGSIPYTCVGIEEVRYKGQAPIRDSSRLIYRNGRTYHKSPLREHVEGAEGEVTINHELKSVTYSPSDSILLLLQKELKIKPDPELEAQLDPNAAASDLAYFSRLMAEGCNVTWEMKDGLEEISFVPKNVSASTLISLRIRYGPDDRVRYYEYSLRDVYAKDLEGNAMFRVVRTIFDNFSFDNVPQIPAKPSDFLEWHQWTIRLKKYKNYQLSVL